MRTLLIIPAFNEAACIAGVIVAVRQHFTGDIPWAHLDVASVGDSPDEHHEWTKGPTGFGSRVLLTWLTGPDPLRGFG